MQLIKKYIEAMDDEIEGAKEYAEKYVEYKVKGNTDRASKYKDMAMDELKHASNEHMWVVQEIEELSKVYTPPVEMEEKWNKAHKEYIEKVAWIKQMLNM
jgi:hypothetical protein